MTFPAYPKYKPSGVEWLGDVPEHWEVKPCKYVSKIELSNIDKHSVEGQAPVLLCNYLDVHKNFRIQRHFDFMVATATPSQINRLSIKVGDVIVTKDSEDPTDIGVSTYVESVPNNFTCAYHLALIRPQKCDGEYLNYFLTSVQSKFYFLLEARGITRYALGSDSLRGNKIPIPPLPEQKQIAAFLDRETAKIDELVGEQRRLLDLLKEKRQAVISHAVTRGLNPKVPLKPSGIDWLGDVPEHWRVTPLRAIATIVRGASPRPSGDPRFFCGDAVPWVTVAEITKDTDSCLMETESFLTEEGALLSNLFPQGTLIYSNSGATLGVPKILGMDACANDGVLAFRNLRADVNPLFLYYYLFSLTIHVREKIRQGSGQPNLNTDIVKSFRFVLPSLDEQVAIVRYLDTETSRFDSLTAEAEQVITLLQERRTALISAAVTGQIDVIGATG